jgi:hypothetical protein
MYLKSRTLKQTLVFEVTKPTSVAGFISVEDVVVSKFPNLSRRDVEH